MTTPDIELESNDFPHDVSPDDKQDERKRRKLLLLLILLLSLLCCVGYFFVRYLIKPQPLPEMLIPLTGTISYPPTYISSVGLDGPVGVAVSPDGQRIYAVESTGERLIKMFDRDGNFIKSFAPPGTSKSNRKPAYIAVDASGRVFVNDTYNNVVAIFDADGNFLDGLIDKDVTLSEFVTAQVGSALPKGTLYYFNNTTKTVDYKLPNQDAKSVPGPQQSGWSPLGLRFDPKGNLMVTNIISGKHGVLIYSAADINGSLLGFNPQIKEFGIEGKESGQLSFPNSVVVDSLGNFYVSDGNNGRISVWTIDMQYKSFFAFGSNEDALNLPRGIWMSDTDHLHVADAVGQYIRVYDVSGSEPKFLFNFGEFGTLEGEFNFPIDICIDASGRLYVADRDNNRIQIWSY
jgi:DNA-binding beta-propeller fold protein YncE